MKKYDKFLAGLIVGAAVWLVIAAAQHSDGPQPFQVGWYVQFLMENEKPESGNITSIAGKWVKLETQFANGGPKALRWVNTDYVRMFSLPAATPAAGK